MRRFVGSYALALIVALSLGSIVSAAPAPAAPKAPGLGDPGKLVGLELIGGGADKSLLRGADDRLQLVVSGKYDSGQYRDFTRKAKYEVDAERTEQVRGMEEAGGAMAERFAQSRGQGDIRQVALELRAGATAQAQSGQAQLLPVEQEAAAVLARVPEELRLGPQRGDPP